MPKKLIALLIYTAVIILFFFHFHSAGPGLASNQMNTVSRKILSPAEGLPLVSRTEKELLPGTPDQTLLHVIESGNEGPTVLIIGGIHGNEPAGVLAAEYIATWAIDRGRLLVIPKANIRALAAHTRFAPGGKDLNRSFPGASRGDSTRKLAWAIYSQMDEFRPQWVIDLHEARNFEAKIPGDLGQTIIYPRSSNSLDMINRVVEVLNNGEAHDSYPFILRRGAIAGGTIWAAVSLGLDGFMVETCYLQPIERRVNQQLRAVSTFLELNGITVY